MSTQQQAKEFIENSCPAIEHLFLAISEYTNILESAQKSIEEIEHSKQMLSDLFMYRDQWSPDANHHYAQYLARIQSLENEKQDTKADVDERLENALNSIGTTVESMSTLAGTILQIAKQTLSIQYSGKTSIEGAKNIGTQSIIEIIWEGRNHAMHWEEGAPKDPVHNMLTALSVDIGITIEPGKNNCLSILGVLGWKSTNDVITDLNKLVN